MIHFPPLAAFLNSRWASAGLFHFIRETLHLSYSPVSSRWTFQKTCRSLLSLLQRYAPQSIHALTPSHLLYRRVAVDADYFIARFAHVASPDLLPPSVLSSSSDAGRVMRRIRPSLLRLCRWLQRQSLRSPIFVFDGVRVQAKNGEATRRLRLREEALEKHRELWESLSSQGGVPTTPSLSTLSTPAEQRRIVKQLLSYQQRIHHPTAEMKQECMRLLRQHSAAVVRAPNEAEAMCAHLAEEGHVGLFPFVLGLFIQNNNNNNNSCSSTFFYFYSSHLSSPVFLFFLKKCHCRIRHHGRFGLPHFWRG